MTFPIPMSGPRIVEDSEAALEQFREIASDLGGESVKLKDLESGTVP
jgi:hypothetical protein